MQRFWSYVERRADGECWLWTGAKVYAGYGRIYWDGRPRQAHRVAYQLEVGPIPDGLELDHLCRNPPCVNPAHLEAVTPRVNKLRSDAPTARNFAATECVNGHPFDEANTYTSRDGRHCRRCRAAAEARRRAKIPPVVHKASCVMCGATFEYVRQVGGRSPNTCSDSCTADRKRKAARECQRRKRGAAT